MPVDRIRLYTIGFTKKSAEQFFGLLRDAGVKRVIDIRLNNTSHLAAFAKKDDLKYFLREICGIDYVHRQDMAPSQELLDAYKKNKGSWELFESGFVDLITERALQDHVSAEELDGACLLCSEHEPDHCHRRLLAEYLSAHDSTIEIVHLL